MGMDDEEEIVLRPNPDDASAHVVAPYEIRVSGRHNLLSLSRLRYQPYGDNRDLNLILDGPCKRNLIFPGFRTQRPAVAEPDGIASAPIVEENFCTDFRL